MTSIRFVPSSFSVARDRLPHDITLVEQATVTIARSKEHRQALARHSPTFNRLNVWNSVHKRVAFLRDDVTVQSPSGVANLVRNRPASDVNRARERIWWLRWTVNRKRDDNRRYAIVVFSVAVARIVFEWLMIVR